MREYFFEAGPEVNWAGLDPTRVQKVVIGTLEKSKTVSLDARRLWESLAGCSALRSLYLWNCRGVTEVPDLPALRSLRVLDLRGCEDLVSIHLSGAQELETLDLSRCPAIRGLPDVGRESLRWLYLEGCVELDEESLQRWIDDRIALEELSLADCTQLTLLQLPLDHRDPSSKGRLRKLVLRGCRALRELRPKDLGRFPHLGHLDVNDCVELERLPRLPVLTEPDDDGRTGIQYLVCHDSPKLREFCGLDIREPHRSQAADENVAESFRAMQLLAEPKGKIRQAKLLLLGSGRCGKTTTAMGLQWGAMVLSGKNPEADAELSRTRNPNHAFSRGEPIPLHRRSTHGVQFWDWEVPSALDSGADGLHAHIWDFGGQEIYHSTHRVFASQGSVFLIVTTHRTVHEARVEKELNERGCLEGSPERQRHLLHNEYRELPYWLDYVRNALQLRDENELAGRVAILYAGPAGPDDPKSYLRSQAGEQYGRLLSEGRVPVFRVGFLDADHEDGKNGYVRSRHFDFERLLHWVVERLVAATDQLGRVVPGYFATASQWARERSPAGIGTERGPGATLVGFAEWQQQVAVPPALDSTMQSLTREEPQTRAVLRYLHHCGRVFWLQDASRTGDVIIDQRWGVKAVYEFLRPESRVQDLASDGLLKWSEFRKTDFFLNDLQTDALLGRQLERVDHFRRLLDQCAVAIPLGNGEDLLLLQRDVLEPLSKDLTSRLESDWWQAQVTEAQAHRNHSFVVSGTDGTLLGRSDYGQVLAVLARAHARDQLAEFLLPDEWRKEMEKPGRDHAHWGRERAKSTCRVWQDGCQFWLEVDPELGFGDVVLRIEWRAVRQELGEEPGAFAGRLYVQLLSTDPEATGERLMSTLFDAGGPLAIFKDRVSIDDRTPSDLSAAVMACPRGPMLPWTDPSRPPDNRDRHQVGISFRSPDLAVAEQIFRFLELNEVDTYYYAEDRRLNRRQDGSPAPIREIYGYLNKARVLLIIASADYFAPPAAGNTYCPVELAQAVTDRRTPSVVVVHRRSEGYCFQQTADDRALKPAVTWSPSQVVRVIEDAYKILDAKDSRTRGDFENLEWQSLKNSASLDKAQDFFRSSAVDLGDKCHIQVEVEHLGESDLDKILETVKRLLGAS
ncbi:MAG: hypothetical protein AB7O52_01575 [Planctomycetota bacterium]